MHFNPKVEVRGQLVGFDFPSTIWVQGIELKLSALMASVFTPEAVLLVPVSTSSWGRCSKNLLVYLGVSKFIKTKG